MNNLVGRCFSLAEGRYRIVDVRNLGGESMVYAEKLQETAGQDSQVRQRHYPRRAAFHYDDIAEYLSAERSA